MKFLHMGTTPTPEEDDACRLCCGERVNGEADAKAGGSACHNPLMETRISGISLDAK